jgi:26S proteasome regulatory subunit T5
MASLEALEDLENEQQERRKEEDDKKKKDGDDKKKKDGDDNKMDVDEEKPDEDAIDPDILNAATQDIINRRRLLDNDLRIMRQEYQRLTHEKSNMKDKIKDNLEKIENNR